MVISNFNVTDVKISRTSNRKGNIKGIMYTG